MLSTWICELWWKVKCTCPSPTPQYTNRWCWSILRKVKVPLFRGPDQCHSQYLCEGYIQTKVPTIYCTSRRSPKDHSGGFEAEIDMTRGSFSHSPNSLLGLQGPIRAKHLVHIFGHDFTCTREFHSLDDAPFLRHTSSSLELDQNCCTFLSLSFSCIWIDFLL